MESMQSDRHSMHCPEIGRAVTQVGRPRQRMIFAQMAGLLAMPTLLPEGVLWACSSPSLGAV